MSTDILFLAEFAGGAPARSAQELATGAAELASQSGGAAVALAYGSGAAAGAAGLGAHGATRAIVLGDDDRPAITYAPAAVAAARDAGLALLAPATPNGRDLAAALVGSLHIPAFGPVRAARIAEGALETEQATLQGSVITTSRPVDGAPTPAVVLVLANTFTPAEGGAGTAEVSEAPAAEESALIKASVAES